MRSRRITLTGQVYRAGDFVKYGHDELARVANRRTLAKIIGCPEDRVDDVVASWDARNPRRSPH